MQPDSHGAEPNLVAMVAPRFSLRDVLAVPTVRQAAWFMACHVGSGALVGLIWLWTAPKTVSYVIPFDKVTLTLPAQSEAWIAGDGRFAALAVVAGAIAAAACWSRPSFRRLRGATTILMLTLGGLAGAGTALVTGQLLSGGHESGAPRTAIAPPLHLHAHSLLLMWAFGAVLTATLVAGLSNDETLGVPERDNPGRDLAASAAAETGAQ